jgi:hypothetical protein
VDTIVRTENRFKEFSMFEPLITNEIALIRALKTYAAELGLSELMGNATAQVFLKTNPALSRWDQWMRSQCAACGQSPNSCTFLLPPEDQIPASLTPEQLITGNVIGIESGRIKMCPRYVDRG